MVIVAVAAPLAVILVACGVGRGYARLFGFESGRGEGAFYAVAGGLGILSLDLFLAGLLGWLHWVLVALIFALTAAFLRRDCLWCLSALWGVAKRFLRPGGFFNAILMCALLAAVAINFFVALAPPTETDSLTLHLVMPRAYAETGTMFHMPDNWDSTLSLGPHLLYTAVMLITGPGAARIAPAVLHWIVGLIFALWVWQFARRRLGRSPAYAAAAILYCTPMVAHFTSAPMADGFYAFYAFAALAALLAFMERGGLKHAAAAGAFAGFAAGVKFHGLALMAAVCVAAALAAAFAPQKRLHRLRGCVVAALAAAVLACPWYIRNYIWTGNPVFPAKREVFGTAGWQNPSWQDGESGDSRYARLHKSATNMLLAPWRMTTDAKTTSGGISGAVAPAFLVFLPLALMLRSRRRLFLHLGLYCLVGFLVVYWTSPRPRSRYYLSVWPVAAVFAGAGLLFLRRYSRAAFGIGRVVVLLSVLSGLAVGGFYARGFFAVVTGVEHRDDFLSRTTDFYDTYMWMEANLPADSLVMVGATNDLYYCPVKAMRFGTSDAYTHCDSRAVFGLGPGSTVQAALGRMKELGVTHVFVHEGFADAQSTEPARALLGEMVTAGDLNEIYSADDTRGTRNPFAKQRQEALAIYRVAYQEGRNS